MVTIITSHLSHTSDFLLIFGTLPSSSTFFIFFFSPFVVSLCKCNNNEGQYLIEQINFDIPPHSLVFHPIMNNVKIVKPNWFTFTYCHTPPTLTLSWTMFDHILRKTKLVDFNVPLNSLHFRPIIANINYIICIFIGFYIPPCSAFQWAKQTFQKKGFSEASISTYISSCCGLNTSE